MSIFKIKYNLHINKFCVNLQRKNQEMWEKLTEIQNSVCVTKSASGVTKA